MKTVTARILKGENHSSSTLINATESTVGRLIFALIRVHLEIQAFAKWITMTYRTLRVARHTNNLELLIDFYQRIVGLSLLGRFEDHESYSGAFLGVTGAQWHLEFTTSPHPPVHTTDPDDALVLYVNSQEELNDQRATLERENIALVTNQNPYWNRHGITFRDPDGFLVIFAHPRLSTQV